MHFDKIFECQITAWSVNYDTVSAALLITAICLSDPEEYILTFKVLVN
jgi:hypothetical protein